MNSINLLPPDLKEALEQKKKNLVIVRIFRRMIWIFLLVVMTVTGTWYYLENSARNIDPQLISKNEAIASYGTLENDARKVADKISAIKTIENGLNSWEGVIAEIQKAMPSSTYLSKVSLNSDGKVRATMSGFSKSKQNVAVLRNALEESEYFEFVDIDNATTEEDPITKTDIESFTLSFSLEKGALDE